MPEGSEKTLRLAESRIPRQLWSLRRLAIAWKRFLALLVSPGHLIRSLQWVSSSTSVQMMPATQIMLNGWRPYTRACGWWGPHQSAIDQLPGVISLENIDSSIYSAKAPRTLDE
ncbi:hypothetical protein BU23DRAFT_322261 [Bimuria novae-zelandiae CBS 107.79]|uniref:Uncharacterized protein n=1 Tax=Bimuria novae-zelandiae CBS 107.79 TaxID=1447943 RepID=A0A6A5VIW2_9PLEO|nr:hypothetical protein BU23DRAFT_322261 [Bimuria novae-zelandiae CBS 107.79]